MSPSSRSGTPTVLWAAVARNDQILVEAGEDNADKSISSTAKELLKREPTPGWEFHTQSRKSRIFGVKSTGTMFNNTKSPRLKGAKFHVYDKDVDGNYIVWVFLCVYNPSNIQRTTVQTFLTKLVSDTEHERQDDLRWLYGPTLACQESFGPMLRHYMMQVSHLEKYASLENHLENAKQQMHKNIELILANEANLQDLDDEATKLQEMAAVFQKKAEKVHRMKMWHNARHGILMGTAGSQL